MILEVWSQDLQAAESPENLLEMQILRAPT